ncbi:Flap-structured DNA-binding and RNA-binding protein [Emydomyces testavorans]|uniref:RNA-binding protein VTS1 n=1 Tax=Emydomyces testavorans TaxID=2070801 RepID=A0AAF0DJS8_9EURO|nr:Flap-structured DNA-binding and RNA-binding protein [Emydomyces testavorans]
MASHIIGNRNSTPEASKSTLRPPSSSRTLGGSHQLRASADMSGFSSPLAARNIRPSSEVYFNQQSQGQNSGEDALDRAAQQWIADIDQYETTLEEMAAATLDQDFKDELSAIEQWFRVLSEAERTAALYALLQQTTQVQIRFFIQVLQQMSQSHPMSSVLSPANFGEKDPMSNRLSDAMAKLNVEPSRSSLGRPPPSPGNKRNSGLDSSTINAMFPDAAAAIAKKKAEFTQQTGNLPGSNRNSAVFGERTTLVTPTISTPDCKDNLPQPPASPWVQRASEPQAPIARPKSSGGQQQPMGQFSQPLPSLRSPLPMNTGASSSIQSTTITAPEITQDPPLLSPYNLGNASWASMSNTPMVPSFNQQTSQSQADMVANATAMKLAALSTVNNRIALDDARKYRRARSNDGQKNIGPGPLSPGLPNTNIPGTNVIMVNDAGQILNPQQIAALQAQQQAVAMAGRRSRPNSPGLAMQGGSMGHLNFTSPQNNGFLAAYDTNTLLSGSFSGMGMGLTGAGNHEGYLSDHSEINRGRSPRGRRGSSKPPEDPTDTKLLQDIPAWLRSLRLHKYTDNLKDLKWTELIELDDKSLEARGVNALGARNKMLKVSRSLPLSWSRSANDHIGV